MIYGFSMFGYEGSLISVEADVRSGISATDIVGISDGCVKETKERVKSAYTNALRELGIEYPNARVLVSLSPCDLKKDGTGYDLAIALAIYLEQNLFNDELGKSVRDKFGDVLVMGELALSGDVFNVRGVEAGLQTAVARGIKFAIVPHYETLQIPKGIKVATVGNLYEACDAFLSLGDPKYFKENTQEDDLSTIEFEQIDEKDSLDTIKGMNGLKYAMAVAVAGRHNILAYGATGCGKTIVLQRMKNIMPKLSKDEKQSVDRIYSLAGLSNSEVVKEGVRPFRVPHQTASIEGICGGGVNCNPGEISLAHNGVLFLDEAAEFRSSVLQMLRVPLEGKTITLSRAGRSTTYPANFQLVMATNPCPCGNYGASGRNCLCSMKSIEMYWRKFSAPLLDRVAIRYNCNAEDSYVDMSQSLLREMVRRAWERQFARQGKWNNDLTIEEVKTFIPLSEEIKNYLENYDRENSLSPRALKQIITTARTVADMHQRTGTDPVSMDDIERAIELRGMVVTDNL